MDFLWALIALALGFLLYPAWQIIRSLMRGSSRNPGMATVSPAPDRGAIRDFSDRQTRPLQWISLNEFAQLLAQSRDLVVIDLRPEPQRQPLAFPAGQVLSIAPSELPELLEWLPQNRSAVFCGASGIALSLIRTSNCMRGSAPLYVLKDGSARAEVA